MSVTMLAGRAASRYLALMLLRSRPTDAAIDAFIAAQAGQPFSYAEVGASAGDPPGDYVVDRNHIRLGTGAAVFDRAAAALRRWAMFEIAGVQLCWPDAAI